MTDKVVVELAAGGEGVTPGAMVVKFGPVKVDSALALFDFVATCFSHPLMQGIRKKYRLVLYRTYPTCHRVYVTGFLRTSGMERIEEKCTETWANLVRWVYWERGEARWEQVSRTS